MSKPKLIVRLIGGLGNQMFGYAAARRLALANDAELVIDPWSGFARDVFYQRQYALAPYKVAARLAKPGEMLWPFERGRRELLKWREARKPFDKRRYILQQGVDFEGRLLARRLEAATTFIEGVWPSEGYFADESSHIRSELALRYAPVGRDAELGQQMQEHNSVAVHVRFFKPDMEDTTSNIGLGYYRGAIAEIQDRVGPAHFYVFSDRPAEAAQMLMLAPGTATLVDHNSGEVAAPWDLWLMSHCRHAIIANSTFSWWGAWLGDARSEGRIVIAPDPALYPAMGWSSQRLVPDRWLTV